MEEEPKPLRDLAEGSTRALLDFGAEKVAELARRFKNRELRFIQDERTIEEVRQERHSREYAGYEPYLKSTRTRVPVQLGLALRKTAKDPVIVENLRTKIRKKFGLPGLHLAQAAQAGILSVLMSELRKVETDHSYEDEVLDVFENIDRYVIFFQATVNVNLESGAVLSRLRTGSPPVFAIAGSGNAIEQAAAVARTVVKAVEDQYEVQKIHKGQEITYVFTLKT